MSTIISFITQNWFYIIAAFVAVAVISFIFRFLFKAVFILIIVALVMVLVFHFTPNQVANIGQNLYNQTIGTAINSEIASAKFVQGADGSFTIEGNGFSISGNRNNPQVVITYQGHTYTISASQLGQQVQSFISQNENKSG